MKEQLVRTLNYFKVTPHFSRPDLGGIFEAAFNAARTAGERIRQINRTVLANTINRNRIGLEVTFLSFDQGYRPKKIAQILSNPRLSPEQVNLALTEEVVEIVHLFLRLDHAILESRQGAVSPLSVAQYVSWLIQEKYDRSFQGILFNPAARPDLIAQMRKHGVKQITFDIVNSSRPPNGRLFGSLANTLSRLRGSKAVVAFRPTKREHLDVSEVESTIQNVQNADEVDNIKVILGNKNTITYESFKLKKSVHVRNDGTKNAVSSDIFGLMQEAYFEWVKDGYIQDDEMGK